MDDHQLIARVLAGAAGAERELYDRYVDRVYRLAYRLAGDADLARDFTQDAFIRVFDRLADQSGVGLGPAIFRTLERAAD